MALSAAPSYLSDNDVVRLHWSGFFNPAITSGEVEIQEVGPSVSAEEARQRTVTEWVTSYLDPVRALPPNWDSYGGRPITAEALNAAEHLATGLLMAGHPWPAFVPRADGGISLVWDRPEVEFAIELPAGPDPLSDASAFFADDAAGEEWEDRFDLADPRVGTALQRLVQ